MLSNECVLSSFSKEKRNKFKKSTTKLKITKEIVRLVVDFSDGKCIVVLLVQKDGLSISCMSLYLYCSVCVSVIAARRYQHLILLISIFKQMESKVFSPTKAVKKKEKKQTKQIHFSSSIHTKINEFLPKSGCA